MVPLTVFTTYGIVTQLTGGRLSVAYLVTLAAMVFTARSYARMAAAYPVAGSAYAYTQKSFGAPIGFLAGWSLLLDYLFLPMLNYLVIGIYMGAAIPAVPAWVFILVAIVAVTVLNIVGIVSVARANFLLLALQIVFIAVFVVMAVATISGAGSVNLMAPFTGDGTVDGASPIFAGAAILCLSFLGFDAVSTLSEEAKDPTRSVPKAIMIATVVSGLIFFGLSYVSQLVFPSNNFEDVDAGSLDVMTTAGGQFLNTFFTAAYVAGCIGSALTSQASVARILFAMGRDGILPRRVFGHVSLRFSTPTWAILIVSVISLAALWIDLTLLASLVSFGALVAFSAVNLTVIKHYFIDQGDRGGGGTFNNLVLPLIGFRLTGWLWTSLSGLTLVIGLDLVGDRIRVAGSASPAGSGGRRRCSTWRSDGLRRAVERVQHDPAGVVGDGFRVGRRLGERHRNGWSVKGFHHQAVVALDVAAVAPRGDAAGQGHAREPKAVVEDAVAVGHGNGVHHFVELGGRDDPPVEQRGDERGHVLVGGDQRSGHAGGGGVEVGDVGAAAVHHLVAVRERRAQPGIARRGEVRLEQPERHDDSPGDLLGGRPSGDRLDQQAGDDVVGVGVFHRGARRELGGSRQRRVEELIARSPVRSGGGVSFVVVLRQAALMAQQLTHGDRVGVDALAADAAGQVRLDGRVEVDLALGDELQNRRCDKGFRDAGDADMGLRRRILRGCRRRRTRRRSG